MLSNHIQLLPIIQRDNVVALAIGGGVSAAAKVGNAPVQVDLVIIDLAHELPSGLALVLQQPRVAVVSKHGRDTKELSTYSAFCPFVVSPVGFILATHLWRAL